MKRFKIVPLLLALAVPIWLSGCSPKTDGEKTSGTLTADQTEDAFLADVRNEASKVPAGAGTGVASALGQPKIELQTTAYDMGVVPSTEIAVRKMKIFNRGEAPLKIDRIATSCGCTTGEMEQSLIPPGGEANLVIRVDPKRIPGFYANKALTVHNNDPANPHPVINVVTHVEPEVEIDPEILDFGTVQLGESAKATVRVRQMQDAPFELSGAVFQRDPPFLHVTQALAPETEWRRPGKREYVITVDILPSAPSGPYDEWVILSTNLTRMQQMPLKFKGIVVGPYEFVPRTVTMRGVAPGTPLTHVLTLTGKQDLRVIEVTNSNTAVQITHGPGEKPNTVTFGFTVPQRTPSPSLRDTWKIVFEVAGQRHEESVPVVIILTRQN
jgi:hypothetical protein